MPEQMQIRRLEVADAPVYRALRLRALREHGFQAITQDVILVRLEDKPGALAEVAKRLSDAGLDLRSMHIVRREAGKTLAGLVASDPAKATEVLRELLVTT